MTCSHCGRTLDAQALELGACRYCGQSLPDQLQARPDTSSMSTVNQQALPTASQPEATDPTLPRLDESAANSAWNPTSQSAFTEFGLLTDAPVDAFAPAEATPRVTTPFGSAPDANIPPPGGALPPMAAYPPASAAPGRKGAGKKLALAIVAVVLLVVVIGGGLLFARSFNKSPAGAANSPQPTSAAAPSPTASPTPTAIPTSAYHDPNGLFSIRYPAIWTRASFTPSGVPVPLPLSGVRFSGALAEFDILTGQEAPLLPTNGLAAQADDALLSTMSAQHVSSARAVSIGGQSWTEKSADTSDDAQTVIASISFKNHLYSLWYSAPTALFSAAEQQFFNPMIASFTFGG